MVFYFYTDRINVWKLKHQMKKLYNQKFKNLIRKKENCIMKKTLVALFTLVALSIGIQAFAACCDPCAKPCDPCPACPCAPCNDCVPKCKCTWWKIFEDKTCCYKCNNECDSCFSAKRAHWYKFWTDRCVVPNVKCDDCGCPCK